MPLDRRTFLRNSGLAALVASAPLSLAARRGGVVLDPPATGFEQTGTWTTHEAEVALLEQIAAERPDRVRLEVIGTTGQGRPLHLLTIGAAQVEGLEGTTPTVMFVGSQHGNEPAGRETCLKLIRDLAYTEDADLLDQLSRQTVLVVPSANPDGREANTRGNGDGVDINRDHLALRTIEAQAIAEVFNRFHPSMVLDLHEYGPSVPVLYDDDLLYLWPRNLNVDPAVQDNARSYCLQYLRPDCQAAGYTADEYGLYKVGPNVGPATGLPVDAEVTQTAGDGDEGICRNAMGLRHAMGILVESRVMVNPAQSPDEVAYDGEGGSIYGDSRAARERRVASQLAVTASTIRYFREQGEAAKAITDGAPARKAREGQDRSAPLYFDGADNEAPTSMASPPPSGYAISPIDELTEARTLDLHGVSRRRQGDQVIVTMGQHAEPVVGLLLDARGSRNVISGEPLD